MSDLASTRELFLVMLWVGMGLVLLMSLLMLFLVLAWVYERIGLWRARQPHGRTHALEESQGRLQDG